MKKIKHNGTVRASSLTEQTDSVRSLSVRSSNSVERLGSRQQRRGECSCAVEIVRPSSPPCQEGWPHQCGLLLRCSRAGQTFNQRFRTPAPRFQGHDNKAPPIASQQLSAFVSLSALSQTWPSTWADPGLVARQALREVMSLPVELRETTGARMRGHRCAFRLRPSPPRFMSRSRQLNRTLAWASRRTPAKVLSSATALVRNRPQCGQAALCRPLLSTHSPHSHLPSVTAKGNLSLSRIKVRYRAASSGLVGHPWSTLEEPPPE